MDVRPCAHGRRELRRLYLQGGAHAEKNDDQGAVQGHRAILAESGVCDGREGRYLRANVHAEEPVLHLHQLPCIPPIPQPNRKERRARPKAALHEGIG